VIARQFATLTNYDAGPSIGTPTKIAPPAPYSTDGFAAQIFAQHANYAFERLEEMTIRKVVRQAQQFGPQSGFTIAHADAVSGTGDGGILLLNSTGTASWLIGAQGQQSRTATSFSVGAVRSVFVQSIKRVFALGAAAGPDLRSQYTDDSGLTWSTAQVVSAVTTDRVKDFIHNPHDGFLYLAVGGNTESSSATNLDVYRRATGNADTWSLRSTLSCHRDRHLAASPGVLLLATCDRTTPALVVFRSTDGGVNWSSSTVTHSASNARPVGVVWDEIHEQFVILATHPTAGSETTLSVYTSPTGQTWTTAAATIFSSLTVGPVSFDGNGEQHLVYFKGLLLALTTGTTAITSPVFYTASSDGGVTWRLPLPLAAPDVSTRLINCGDRLALVITTALYGGVQCG
jgi:hypothetical protein